MKALGVDSKLSYDSFIESERAVAEVSLDGCWLRTNSALCKLLGYEAHELKSMRVRDVTHPEDRALSVNIVDQALRHHERFQQELKRYVRKDGAVVWVLLQTTLKRDADGEPTHFLSFLEDVTYRVAHEPLARAIAARMQSLQEQEKSRIARELHDQLGQSLSALKFEVSWLKSKLPEGLEAHAARLSLSIDSILNSVRELWKGLRPPHPGRTRPGGGHRLVTPGKLRAAGDPVDTAETGATPAPRFARPPGPFPGLRSGNPPVAGRPDRENRRQPLGRPRANLPGAPLGGTATAEFQPSRGGGHERSVSPAQRHAQLR